MPNTSTALSRDIEENEQKSHSWWRDSLSSFGGFLTSKKFLGLLTLGLVATGGTVYARRQFMGSVSGDNLVPSDGIGDALGNRVVQIGGEAIELLPVSSAAQATDAIDLGYLDFLRN